MAIKRDQLGRDEHIVTSMRTHGKALIVPVLVLIVMSALLGLAIAFFPPAWQPWATYASVAVYVLVVVFAVTVGQGSAAPVPWRGSGATTAVPRGACTRLRWSGVPPQE